MSTKYVRFYKFAHPNVIWGKHVFQTDFRLIHEQNSIDYDLKFMV